MKFDKYAYDGLLIVSFVLFILYGSLSFYEAKVTQQKLDSIEALTSKLLVLQQPEMPEKDGSWRISLWAESINESGRNDFCMWNKNRNPIPELKDIVTSCEGVKP